MDTKKPQLVRVSADLVLSELIRDQMDHHKPMNETARLESTATQTLLRSSMLILQSLGFVIAREEQDVV